ncbi:MAG: serine/threonine protein phosphatase [Eubacterium sp.]|nr:serine/threonine protein phosphatase [Eubacterium sp.]
MSRYVIGDIHACMDDLMEMLRVINFSDADELYMVGDYIDRGEQNAEIMRWLEKIPANVHPVRGNHDENYAAYIDIMQRVSEIKGGIFNPSSYHDSLTLYIETMDELMASDPFSARYFDMYGTIRKLLKQDKVTFMEMKRWAYMFRSFPIFIMISDLKRPVVVVHAGYSPKITDETEKLEFFFGSEETGIYSRRYPGRYGNSRSYSDNSRGHQCIYRW